MPKPSLTSDKLRWAQNNVTDATSGQANKAEQSTTMKTDGWSSDQFPPFNWFNYWMNAVWQWLASFIDYPPQSTATVTVAASTSTARGIQNADYICDGTADDVQIQAAIDYCNGLTYGGKVILLEGLYNIAAQINMKSNVTLQGQGVSTQLKKVADIVAIISSGSGVDNCKFIDFYVNGNSTVAASGASYGLYQDNVDANISYTNIKCTGFKASSGAGASGAFAKCSNLVNCIGGSASSSASTRVASFVSCKYLWGCKGDSITSGSGDLINDAFVSCSFLTDCIGNGTTTGTSAGSIGTGFYGCISLKGCKGLGTSGGGSSIGYGFQFCNRMLLNSGVGSTTFAFKGCYADAGSAVALASGGGGAAQADVGTYGFNTGTSQ